MKYAICVVPAAPVRKEPAHRSEMTSQLLFGETAEVLEQNEEWIKIKGTYDGYEGWLTNHLVQPIENAQATAPQTFVTTGLLNPVTGPDGLINLPLGATLTGYDEETRLLWDEKLKYHGTCRNIEKPYSEETFWAAVQPWLNAPYLWGGRTFMGVDCSGFVQTVFKVLGIPLLRDAYQQAEQGTEVGDVTEVQTGDVAFFVNEKGRVVHVGIALQDGRIIHAAGKVRMDTLTREGIVIKETNRQTHQLHSIRRMLPKPL